MSKPLALFAIGLVFGGGLGFAVAAGNGVTFDGHDHADAMDHANMDHDMKHDMPLEVSQINAPAVTLAVTSDPVAGYNLHAQTENFTFAPHSASLANVAGEGHAHVYINDVKLGRLYGEWMHLAALPKGEVTVKVILNSNNHSPFAVFGETISASTVVSVE